MPPKHPPIDPDPDADRKAKKKIYNGRAKLKKEELAAEHVSDMKRLEDEAGRLKQNVLQLTAQIKWTNYSGDNLRSIESNQEALNPGTGVAKILELYYEAFGYSSCFTVSRPFHRSVLHFSFSTFPPGSFYCFLRDRHLLEWVRSDGAATAAEHHSTSLRLYGLPDSPIPLHMKMDELTAYRIEPFEPRFVKTPFPFGSGASLRSQGLLPIGVSCTSSTLGNELAASAVKERKVAKLAATGLFKSTPVAVTARGALVSEPLIAGAPFDFGDDPSEFLKQEFNSVGRLAGVNFLYSAMELQSAELLEKKLVSKPMNLPRSFPLPLYDDHQDPGSSVVVPGVTTPYLYFSPGKSVFTAHVEDMGLPSVNTVVSGPGAKVMVVVSEANGAKLIRQLHKVVSFKDTWPHSPQCIQHLRYANLFITPEWLERNDVPYRFMRQNDGDTMLTLGQSYHWGINLGPNLAVAINVRGEGPVGVGCLCVDGAVSTRDIAA